MMKQQTQRAATLIVNAALYLRLSRDDSNGNLESMSIANQRDFLTAYAEERGWHIHDIYIDDGVSGTTFERPGFQRMIEDIEAGDINLVLTKDLSRLGRNYVETGQYTEFFFPQHNVRYIAVNDNYDSQNEDNDIAPFKHILNEMYAKDISKKIRSARAVSARQGKFMGSVPPFGYTRDLNDKHHLVLDPPAALIVERIFTEYANGDSGRNIAEKLNAERVDCPRAYYYKQVGKPNPNQDEGNTWGSNTVMQLLRNQVYLGHMVQGKRKVVSFKTKRRSFQDESDWIVVENTHESIVDADTWERVQTRIGEMKRVPNNCHRIMVGSTGEVSLFSGFIRCADCGAAMAYNNKWYRGKLTPRYRCSRYTNHGKGTCTAHDITLETLEGVILRDIQYHASRAVFNPDELTAKLLSSTAKERDRHKTALKKTVRDREKRLAAIDNAVKHLFEEKVAGNVPEAMFKKLLLDYEREQGELEAGLFEARQRLQEDESNEADVEKWMAMIRDCISMKELDRATCFRLIDGIRVSEKTKVDGKTHQNIQITYNFVGNID
ncbi:recombinase family protein [Oscillospiraceae bacterium OttesenSCG-928-F05]|nr:recombinase family protein [Oscillospiraceae bacterium OttesenSCG-928-F05]